MADDVQVRDAEGLRRNAVANKGLSAEELQAYHADFTVDECADVLAAVRKDS